MKCKVEGCNNDDRAEGLFDKNYIGLCSKHKMALRRYGNVAGKQPFEQVCGWCGSEFENKYKSNYCSDVCRKKGIAQQITASGKNRESVKKFITNNPDKARAIWRRYKNKLKISNPEKLKARIAARNRIKTEPCIVCNSTSNIQRHHHNYNKPLDIIHLCHTHHRELHSYDSIAV